MIIKFPSFLFQAKQILEKNAICQLSLQLWAISKNGTDQGQPKFITCLRHQRSKNKGTFTHPRHSGITVFATFNLIINFHKMNT